MSAKKLNTATFLLLLRELFLTGEWTYEVMKNKCLLMKRHGSETEFSPLTAVYFHLTGKEIHRGSFWVEEFGKDQYAFPWWEILDITYAWMACSGSGRDYNKTLRDEMLHALR
jgi:hypothetical protein